MLRLARALGALAMVTACSQAPQEMTREQLVERGQYLAMNVGCNDCHTPMTLQGPDMTRVLQGTPLFFRPAEGVEIPNWAPIAPPLAGLPGGFTEEQLASFLQTGVRPDGSTPNPPMPAFRFNEEDARAIAAYISTLPRAQN